MRNAWIVRLLVAAALALMVGWVVHNTSWVEVEVDDPARGAAAADKVYSLRRILAGAGSTLEVRSALEPLPPAGATLVLDSTLWNIFPERDARLKAWVEAGGHLVIPGSQVPRGTELRWMPLSFIPARRPPGAAAARPANTAQSAADDDDDDDEAPVAPPKRTAPDEDDGKKSLQRLVDKDLGADCARFEETADTTVPAFEPHRVYRACRGAGPIHALHAVPDWQLSGTRGTLALRVALGRGSVTGVSGSVEFGNRELLQGDNALVAVAILQAAPGHPVWLVEDEAREPLLAWLWHEARTPLVLCTVAIALALWRLMVRFGPREAVPPLARRSMGEQVRGTGRFIAGTDPEALHAATKQTFEDAARPRVEGWTRLGDVERIAALAALLAPTTALDKAALLASLRIGRGATPAQILAAIAVVESARRALLHLRLAPRAPDTPTT